MTDATPTPDPVTPQPATPAAATPPQSTPAAQPQYATAVPGKTLGIVGLIFSILGFFSLGGASIVGIILGFIGRSQSKAAGVPNGPAKAAIIVGFIALALGIIGVIILVAVGGSLLAACAGLEPGTYQLDDGRVLTCG